MSSACAVVAAQPPPCPVVVDEAPPKPLEVVDVLLDVELLRRSPSRCRRARGGERERTYCEREEERERTIMVAPT
jgi:hypothetical protein